MLTSLGQRVLDAGLTGEGDADLLRDLESLRTDLSATIAHELRTPLTAIRTCAGLLLAADAHPTPEQHRTLVETIERNAERMQRVVGDILDLARFRAGGISLQLRRFDAVAMAEAVIASLEPVARARGIGLALEAAAGRSSCTATTGASSRRSSTSSRTRSASRPTTARVGVAVALDAGTVRLAVRDDGPGIGTEATRPACSSASSSAGPIGAGRATASGSACRRRWPSPRPTTAGSRSTARPGPAARSP